MKKAIIFDFDNTLVRNPDSIIQIKGILAKFPLSLNNRYLSEKIKEAVTDFHLCQLLLNEEDVDKAYDEIVKLKVENIKSLYIPQQIERVLQNLASKHLLFVVSARDHISLNLSLRELGIIKYFKKVLGDIRGSINKNDPSAVLNILEEYFITTKDCIYIGDKELDYKLSLAVGCKFIGAAWYKKSTHIPEEFQCHDADTLEEFIEKLL